MLFKLLPPRAKIVIVVAATLFVFAGLWMTQAVAGWFVEQEPACETVEQVENYDRSSAPGEIDALMELVVLELKAIKQAEDSGDKGLRKAAATSSLGSDFPPDSEYYENPGDVKYNAVANWCEDHNSPLPWFW